MLHSRVDLRIFLKTSSCVTFLNFLYTLQFTLNHEIFGEALSPKLNYNVFYLHTTQGINVSIRSTKVNAEVHAFSHLSSRDNLLLVPLFTSTSTSTNRSEKQNEKYLGKNWDMTCLGQQQNTITQ